MKAYSIKLFIFFNFLIFSAYSYSQNSIILHINPMHAADVNPASAGLGFEYSFKKMSISLNALYTYMEFIESNRDKGSHTGYRIIADLRFPTRNSTIYYNVFPTFWSSKNKNKQNADPTFWETYKKRTKYGIGIGLIKVFRASQHLSFDLTFGLEVNYVSRLREYYDFQSELVMEENINTIQPRIRSGFMMRFQL